MNICGKGWMVPESISRGVSFGSIVLSFYNTVAYQEGLPSSNLSSKLTFYKNVHISNIIWYPRLSFLSKARHSYYSRVHDHLLMQWGLLVELYSNLAAKKTNAASEGPGNQNRAMGIPGVGLKSAYGTVGTTVEVMHKKNQQSSLLLKNKGRVHRPKF